MTDYTHLLPADETEAQTLLCTHSNPNGGTPYDVVYLDIDEDGRVSLTVRTYYGGDGTPMTIWHRRTLRYALERGTDAGFLRDALAEGGEIAELIERIAAGHTVDWDGHNMVGHLTDAAAEASESLDNTLLNLPPYLGEWSNAETWLIGDRSLAAVAAELDADITAQDLIDEATRDHWIITDGLAGMTAALAQVRCAQREAAETDE